MIYYIDLIVEHEKNSQGIIVLLKLGNLIFLPQNWIQIKLKKYLKYIFL
jgi:hypothetical protein